MITITHELGNDYSSLIGCVYAGNGRNSLTDRRYAGRKITKTEIIDGGTFVLELSHRHLVAVSVGQLIYIEPYFIKVGIENVIEATKQLGMNLEIRRNGRGDTFTCIVDDDDGEFTIQNVQSDNFLLVRELRRMGLAFDPYIQVPRYVIKKLGIVDNPAWLSEWQTVEFDGQRYTIYFGIDMCYIDPRDVELSKRM